ncbi:efflux RND transporter periplasmic adaptor subunit [Uliginosibacterium sp. 31-16]|uniref:efflux RND transporter periplasmic adaptor subunit n=1 Tax=Uliginosibacterium sp. 31-16 TaxID=3068315 RepID=UPI00273FC9CC|nr:efflux RND transporter periplasmic adaptor subunit [Uliginosibacterium sp. 31-16]MDP5238542.1 efflux RND transporter periplasmic adaptor subunit [Uliginosibacterium sp. 31-16]
MRLLHRRLLVAALVIAALAAGIGWFKRPQPIAVTVKTVESGKVEASIANTRAGSVEACQRAKMAPIMGGRIEYIGVKEGDHVKAGQVLMRLWNEDQQAQAGLASAQLETVRRRVTEICTAADSAVREAARNKQLFQQGFVSAGREETSRLEADARRAACETARAEVKSSDAKLASVKIEQRRTVLIAPFAGTVAKIVGEVGEYTMPSPPGIVTPPAIDLIDDSCLYVKAPMDEVDAPRLAKGQNVRITLDALPGKPFAGHVRRIAPYVSAVEKQARTVDIEVDFDQTPEARGQLLVGYSADVEVVLASHENVLRIPTAAILEGNRVLILRSSDSKLEERKIKPGIANWEYTEVLEGLSAGEKIVTSQERAGVKAGVLAEAEEDSPVTK